MKNLEIAKPVLLPLSKLQENTGQIAGLPANPRNLNKDKFAKLKKSIQEQPEMMGLRELLVFPVDGGENYVVIGGNMRYKALKDLKYTSAPCKVIPASTPVESLQAYTIKDNASFGEWNFDDLANEWDPAKLNDWGLDLDFSADVLPPAEAVEDGYKEPDDLPARTKRGDIWKLGEHRLMCGDSTLPTDVAELMDGEQGDLVFTDPPYGYEFQSNKRKEKFDVLKNDDKILDFFVPACDVCKGWMFVCASWKTLDKWLPLFKQYRDLSNMIIWHKTQGGQGDLKRTFKTNFEIILCSHGDGEITGHRIGAVWEVGNDDVNQYVHPTQKPVGLSSLAITNCTKDGAVVVDFFGGSGSTLIACEQLKRKARVMELDEHYCDVILDRWEKLTGKEAEKVC